MKDRSIMEIIRDREAILEARSAQVISDFKRDVRAMKPDITDVDLQEMVQ